MVTKSHHREVSDTSIAGGAIGGAGSGRRSEKLEMRAARAAISWDRRGCFTSVAASAAAAAAEGGTAIARARDSLSSFRSLLYSSSSASLISFCSSDVRKVMCLVRGSSAHAKPASFEPVYGSIFTSSRAKASRNATPNADYTTHVHTQQCTYMHIS